MKKNIDSLFDEALPKEYKKQMLKNRKKVSKFVNKRISIKWLVVYWSIYILKSLLRFLLTNVISITLTLAIGIIIYLTGFSVTQTLLITCIPIIISLTTTIIISIVTSLRNKYMDHSALFIFLNSRFLKIFDNSWLFFMAIVMSIGSIVFAFINYFISAVYLIFTSITLLTLFISFIVFYYKIKSKAYSKYIFDSLPINRNEKAKTILFNRLDLSNREKLITKLYNYLWQLNPYYRTIKIIKEDLKRGKSINDNLEILIELIHSFPTYSVAAMHEMYFYILLVIEDELLTALRKTKKQLFEDLLLANIEAYLAMPFDIDSYISTGNLLNNLPWFDTLYKTKDKLLATYDKFYAIVVLKSICTEEIQKLLSKHINKASTLIKKQYMPSIKEKSNKIIKLRNDIREGNQKRIKEISSFSDKIKQIVESNSKPNN